MGRAGPLTGMAPEKERMALRIGDRVTDLTFVQPDGRALSLGAFAGRPLLLVFLRHLA